MTQMCTNWKGERKRGKGESAWASRKKIGESPIKDYKYKLDEKEGLFFTACRHTLL